MAALHFVLLVLCADVEVVQTTSTMTTTSQDDNTDLFSHLFENSDEDIYKIDGIDVLHDASISSVKSFILNARIIQNLNSSKDGLFINYMTGGTATTAHCRFYSGGNTT